MSLHQDEALHMFFDPGFNPAEYVDALYASVTNSGDKYAPQNIKKVAKTTQELIARLDYNTTEIVTELTAKMDQLRKLTATAPIPELVSADPAGATAESKRLEYYVDVLRHSVETLADEAAQRQKRMAPLQASQPLETLSQLKVADANLVSAASLLASVRRTVGNIDTGTGSLSGFQEHLSALQESIRTRLKEGTSEEREELHRTIEKMRTWVPLFQPFAHFGPVFEKFVSRLENEV